MSNQNPSPQLTNVTITRTSVSGVVIIALARPEKRNAVTQAMVNSMIEALRWADKDENVRSIVVTGSPFHLPTELSHADDKDNGVADKKNATGHFSAGMDLGELIQLTTSKAHEREYLKDLTDAFGRTRKPIIAAVTGFACDMIVAAEDSQFGQPEVLIGTIPGAGGTQRMARALGKYRAMEFVLMGCKASGRQFYDWGVINYVCPSAEEVIPKAVEFAGKIAALSLPVVLAGKKAVLAAEKSSSIDDGLDMEKMLYYATFDLNDFKEGVGAFLEKRKPTFQHQ